MHRGWLTKHQDKHPIHSFVHQLRGWLVAPRNKMHRGWLTKHQDKHSMHSFVHQLRGWLVAPRNKCTGDGYRNIKTSIPFIRSCINLEAGL
eukprot:g2348.t1